ncbi:MAG: YdcF family protein [Parvularculaceae bacterium]
MAKRLFLILVAGTLAWIAGLFIFVGDLPQPDSDSPAPADGVVVFTGGGERISTAMTLLNDGAGKRLLISGVNPNVSREELAKFWSGDPQLFECCVDLGVEAETTEQNAGELDAWTRANGYRSLILVTSEFHMPRALLEARERLPDIVITPYPVESGLLGPNGRPHGLSGWKRINGEYAKYLAVRIKTFLN